MKNHAKSGPVEMDTCVWETLWKPGGERPLPQGGLWDAELMGTGTLGRSLTRRTSRPGRCLRQAWPKGQGHSLPKAHTLLSAHMPLSIMAHMPPSRHRAHTGLHSAPPRPSAKTVSKGLMQPAQHSREGFPGAPALSAGTPGAVAFWVLAGSLLCPCRVTPAPGPAVPPPPCRRGLRVLPQGSPAAPTAPGLLTWEAEGHTLGQPVPRPQGDTQVPAFTQAHLLPQDLDFGLTALQVAAPSFQEGRRERPHLPGGSRPLPALTSAGPPDSGSGPAAGAWCP